jgi:hypothetical protein
MVPEDPKNAHLLALDGAQERLSLYHADVLDYMSLCRAFSLCHGVFHVASPVSNDPVSSLYFLLLLIYDRYTYLSLLTLMLMLDDAMIYMHVEPCAGCC